MPNLLTRLGTFGDKTGARCGGCKAHRAAEAGVLTRHVLVGAQVTVTTAARRESTAGRAFRCGEKGGHTQRGQFEGYSWTILTVAYMNIRNECVHVYTI